MLSYRIIATRHGGDITCQAQIRAWDEHDSTWAWQPLQSWSLAAPTDENLSTVLSHDLATHGWHAAPETITAPLPATIPAEPQDHAQVLQHLTDQLAQLTQYKSALKSAVASVPAHGQPGHITTTEISRITGISRAQLTAYRRATPQPPNA